MRPFDVHRPSAFFMFGLFLCVEYQIPDAGYIYVASLCFLLCFSFRLYFLVVCAFLYLLYWREPSTLCLKGEIEGVTLTLYRGNIRLTPKHICQNQLSFDADIWFCFLINTLSHTFKIPICYVSRRRLALLFKE